MSHNCTYPAHQSLATWAFPAFIVFHLSCFNRIGPNGVKYDAQLINEVCLSDLHGEFCQVAGISELYI